MGHPHAASLSRAPGLVERRLPRQGDLDGVQELVCVAEKQSEEENATFISKQKQTHVKLLLCCCTRKPGQGSAQASRRQAAPGSRSPSAPCLAVTAKIDTTVGIDYSLTAPPVATAQFLNADLKVRGCPRGARCG